MVSLSKACKAEIATDLDKFGLKLKIEVAILDGLLRTLPRLILEAW